MSEISLLGLKQPLMSLKERGTGVINTTSMCRKGHFSTFAQLWRMYLASGILSGINQLLELELV